MRCTNCGCENHEGSDYCATCGTPLEKTDDPIHEAVMAEEQDKPSTPPKNNLKIVIIILTVLLVAAIAVAAVFIIKAKTAPEEPAVLVTGMSQAESAANSNNEPVISADSHDPFYGILCSAYKDNAPAQKDADMLAENGFPNAQVIITTDWGNLNSEKWYVVTAGKYESERAAKGQLPDVQVLYADAYVKYSGDWIGDGGTKETTAAQTTAPTTTQAPEDSDRAKALEYLDNAENALREGNRQTAFDMAAKALELCPDDEYVADRYEYFKSYLPFGFYDESNVLSSKKSSTAGTWTFIHFDQKRTSNNNQTMPNSIVMSYDKTSVESGNHLYTLTYSFAYDYDTISGTSYVLEKSKNVEQSGYFVIYGDGKKLYTSQVLGVNVLPEDFSFNVKGVKTVTIEFYGDTNFYSLNGDSVSYGISSFVALKDLP